MSETIAPQTERPESMLARSLFGFALLLFIPALLVWISFVASPLSPSPQFNQIRTLIIIGWGSVTAICLGVVVLSLTISEERALNFSTQVVGLARRLGIMSLIGSLLIELNFIAFLGLQDVAPAYVTPAKWLLLAWSILLAIIILIANLDRVRTWLVVTTGFWRTFGLMIGAIGLILIGVVFNSLLIRLSGLNDALRGGLDYRPLEFVDDGQAPEASAFWREQSLTRVQWMPYSYWAVGPLAGTYINVDEQGLRQTVGSVSPDENNHSIYFFGGSTLWGEGARDAYTIPSIIATALNAENTPQTVVNYGQTGYVSTQDMILYQMQLARNNVPDIAVFYQGFNDLYSGYLQGQTGLAYQELLRFADSEAGRALRIGQPVLRLPDVQTPEAFWSLVSDQNATAEMIVNRWLENVRMIRAISAVYDVKVVFVWQPALIYKDVLSAREAAIFEQIERELPGFNEQYRRADEYLRDVIARENWEDIIILSDLFIDDERSIFHDRVHVTEIGNQAVAGAILPVIQSALTTLDS